MFELFELFELIDDVVVALEWPKNVIAFIGLIVAIALLITAAVYLT